MEVEHLSKAAQPEWPHEREERVNFLFAACPEDGAVQAFQELAAETIQGQWQPGKQ